MKSKFDLWFKESKHEDALDQSYLQIVTRQLCLHRLAQVAQSCKSTFEDFFLSPIVDDFGGISGLKG